MKRRRDLRDEVPEEEEGCRVGLKWVEISGKPVLMNETRFGPRHRLCPYVPTYSVGNGIPKMLGRTFFVVVDYRI